MVKILATETSVGARKSFVDELRNRFQAGPHFIEAYLDYWENTVGERVSSLAEVEALPAPKPTWFSYALQSNQRGMDVLRSLEPYLQGNHRKSKRYLDVGSGFGGNIAAFAAQGFEVYGTESDPQKLEFSRATGRDFGIEDHVIHASLVDDLKSKIGTFDVITCTEAIRRALDPKAALSNLTGLLNSGGILLLEVPNKDSMEFVAADGNFGLFGITLLDRADSIEYHRHFFRGDYDLGYHHPLNFYREELQLHGCGVSLIDTHLHAVNQFETTSQLTLKVVDGYQRFLDQGGKSLPVYLRTKISAYFKAYISNVTRDLVEAARGQYDIELFRQKYLANFWSLIARKK